MVSLIGEGSLAKSGGDRLKTSSIRLGRRAALLLTSGRIDLVAGFELKPQNEKEPATCK